MSNMVEVALMYRDVRGWCPIPVGRDKKPLEPWAQFQKQLPTDSAIKRGFSRTPQPNIGLVCGALSKLVVLDIDGDERFRALKERGFEIPETLTSRTGRGKHFYFLHPGQPTRNFAKGKRGFPLPGVDFRGDGGYVVAPPSMHATGVQYEFENNHPQVPMPTWLLELVVPSKPETTPAKVQGSRPSETGRKKQGQRMSRPERILTNALERAHNGSRNEMGFWLACQLRDNHLSETEARSYLQRYARSVRDHGDHPYTEQEAMTSLSSAYERSAREEWGRLLLTGPSGPTGPEPHLEHGNPVDRSENETGPDWSHRSRLGTGEGKNEFPSVTGYRITQQGVLWVPDDAEKPEVLITHRPCWVEAHCRDGEREHWGAFLRWIDRDGGIHEIPTPIGRFHEVGGSLPVELANAGLPIVPGREKKLLQYFASCHPVARYRAATMVGWQDGLSVFVLPKETLGETPNAERVVYQPDRYSPSSDTVHARGTLEGWQLEIAKVCQGNPVLTFAV
ncbi:MAG: primase, partial [Nitrospira sp.]|nr:primase [Nitrospira sp.]